MGEVAEDVDEAPVGDLEGVAEAVTASVGVAEVVAAHVMTDEEPLPPRGGGGRRRELLQPLCSLLVHGEVCLKQVLREAQGRRSLDETQALVHPRY